MATAMETAFEVAMTNTCYQTNGNTVTYEPVGSAAFETVVLLSIESNAYPGGHEAQVGEEVVTARVRHATIGAPCVGDKITNAAGVVFDVVHWVQHPESSVEWLYTLKRCE